MLRRMLHQLRLFWAIPALAVVVGVTAVGFETRVPQTVAYEIGRSYAMAQSLKKCADLYHSLGYSTTLSGHLGIDHDIWGARFVAKRKRGME